MIENRREAVPFLECLPLTRRMAGDQALFLAIVRLHVNPFAVNHFIVTANEYGFTVDLTTDFQLETAN